MLRNYEYIEMIDWDDVLLCFFQNHWQLLRAGLLINTIGWRWQQKKFSRAEAINSNLCILSIIITTNGSCILRANWFQLYGNCSMQFRSTVKVLNIMTYQGRLSFCDPLPANCLVYDWIPNISYASSSFYTYIIVGGTYVICESVS